LNAHRFEFAALEFIDYGLLTYSQGLSRPFQG
jgi:hypothetical protein